MKEKDAERISSHIQHSNLTQRLSDDHQKITENDITLAKSVALAAISGYMPFGDDVAKQARYKKFLEVNAELAVDYLSTSPVNSSSKKKNLLPRNFICQC